jgi:peptide deformylase
MKQSSWMPPLPPAREYKKENLIEMLSTSQFLYQVGESPLLRMPTKTIPQEAITRDETKQKIAYLKDCLKKFREITSGKGRGIAAPQVGIPERFAVIYMPERDDPMLTIINPIITKKAEEQVTFPEACMSCNSLIVQVARPAWIIFSYFDEEGKKQFWETNDDTDTGRMYNRIFQHEIDHLDGIINIDYAQGKDLVFESQAAQYEQATFQQIKR